MSDKDNLASITHEDLEKIYGQLQAMNYVNGLLLEFVDKEIVMAEFRKRWFPEIQPKGGFTAHFIDDFFKNRFYPK